MRTHANVALLQCGAALGTLAYNKSGNVFMMNFRVLNPLRIVLV